MAYSLNRAQIIGNITREPEVRQTPNGQFVATFSVATNYTWTDSSGQKQEKVEFHNIVAWRKLAEIIKQYCRKGMKVYVEGKLQTRDWEGEDGVKRYRTEIVADNLIMLGSKGGPAAAPMTERASAGISSPEPSIAEPKASPAAAPAAQASDDITVEDLPF